MKITRKFKTITKALITSVIFSSIFVTSVISTDSTDTNILVEKPTEKFRAIVMEDIEDAEIASNLDYNYTEYDVPKSSGFKSYMSYKAITTKSSPQYSLQKDQAYTGKYGIRQVDGRYCVAVGSYFTNEIGTYLDLILENGIVIPCILADQKADKDTCSKNIITMHNGCVSEFVIDSEYLDSKARQMGDISYCNEYWNSPVETIRVYQ